MKLMPFLIVLAPMILPCGAQSQGPIFWPAPGSPFPVEVGPQNIAVGDVNNDGKLDLITANAKSPYLTVLLGDGNGGFQPAPGSVPENMKGAGEMALGHVNLDQNLDLGLTSHDSYDVTVLLGDGRGGFSPAPGSPFSASDGTHAHTHGLAFGDLNGDGALDIVTVNNEDDSVSVLLGNGTAGFTRAAGSPFAIGDSPYPLALGDIDRDGKLDIVAPNTGSGSRQVTALIGDGRGGFKAAKGSPYSVAPQPYYVTLGDLNGDDKVDLITTHNDSGVMTVLLGDGTGGFRSAAGSPFDLGSRAWGVVAADVSNDQKIDLVAATNNTVTILCGDGCGGFTPARGSPFSVGRGAWRLAIGDVNRDGKPDIATSNLESRGVTVLLAK